MMSLALILSLAALAPQDLKKGVIDPAQAGPDFAVQGEYAADGAKHAAQVVALGDGKFDVYLLAGGLPGAGWDGKGRLRLPAAPADGKTAFSEQGWTGSIADGALSAKGPDGDLVLKRLVRVSPTMGAKPPEGATVLLGDGVSEFTAKGKDAQAVDGTLNASGTGGFWAKKLHGNAKLHVEFMTSFMPYGRGQGRSNSGVYLGGRHECQVLDSFGLKGENNECGGVYSVSKPLVNMALPPLQWQTYDIEYRLASGEKPATMTVVHNGVKIHEGIEIKKTTPAGKDSPPDQPGPLHMQDHGNPVLYRNIWFVELK
jgi:hypothetical protein